ncbi:hypothetical protein [Actinosynnema sp. NPDC020468]|uniref:hypothetical protein n=1 Tax=Actinosynnema sp. NPDC020468 TaxID=3154488 RepID=UPI00340D9563
MSVHAFVDESRRNDTYFLAAAIVQVKDLDMLRTRLKGLLLPGQRELHFRREKPARRRLILSRLVDLGVQVDIYRAGCRAGEEEARQRCLARLVEDLLDIRTSRLVLDSRAGRDKFDRLTIRRVLGKQAKESWLSHEHFDSTGEPLLWIADMVLGCHGLGGDWTRRTAPAVGSVVRLEDP